MLSHLTSTVIPWTFAILTTLLLLGRAKENKNPLEWPLVDRCLILLGLFCLAGGLDNLVTLLEISGEPGRASHLNRAFLDLYTRLIRIMGMTTIILMTVGFVLRRRSPESEMYAVIVIFLNAVTMAFIAYFKGSVTHPAPFLLAMSLGTLSLLLFPPAFSISWITVFSTAVLAAAVMTGLDWLPYAPFYLSSPFSDGRIETGFLLGRTFIIMVMYLLTLALAGYIFLRWQDREKRLAEMTEFLKTIFGRYISVEVMKTLIENPTAMKMGGERRRVVIMMTDLRGFTALSERLEPEQVVRMLNAYFEIMVDVILSFGGTIDEIIGDALLVIFGAPQEMPDRVEKAIACAIAMQNSMNRVNERNRSRGLPALEMGIGLNEDEVIVGNIGSSKRIKYGVVGAGVNMTGRIESYAVGGQILISRQMRQAAGDILRIDARKQVFPKGVDTPLTICEVGGIAGPYNLVLDRHDPELVRPARPIPVTCSVVSGKHGGAEEFEGSIVRLSQKSAGIQMDKRVHALADLKFRLADARYQFVSRDFYGKTVDSPEDGNRECLVRFTAVPLEIASYFQAFIEHAPAGTIPPEMG